jgi:hypothetical protein
VRAHDAEPLRVMAAEAGRNASRTKRKTNWNAFFIKLERQVIMVIGKSGSYPALLDLYENGLLRRIETEFEIDGCGITGLSQARVFLAASLQQREVA